MTVDKTGVDEKVVDETGVDKLGINLLKSFDKKAEGALLQMWKGSILSKALINLHLLPCRMLVLN